MSMRHRGDSVKLRRRSVRYAPSVEMSGICGRPCRRGTMRGPGEREGRLILSWDAKPENLAGGVAPPAAACGRVSEPEFDCQAALPLAGGVLQVVDEGEDMAITA
mmetsp:Transcript_45621/g.83870  ORF Transcript_45621/g.83870 Transcript_45621/m.83870 type:complete len:105 (-) Transcript_45621:276-590(-)